MKSFLLTVLLAPVFFSGIAQLSKSDTVTTTIGPLVIQPLVHASLILSVPGLAIYSDPSGITDFKGLMPPDIILITDIHGDHFDIKTLDAVKKPAVC